MSIVELTPEYRSNEFLNRKYSLNRRTYIYQRLAQDGFEVEVPYQVGLNAYN